MDYNKKLNVSVKPAIKEAMTTIAGVKGSPKFTQGQLVEISLNMLMKQLETESIEILYEDYLNEYAMGEVWFLNKDFIAKLEAENKTKGDADNE